MSCEVITFENIKRAADHVGSHIGVIPDTGVGWDIWLIR